MHAHTNIYTAVKKVATQPSFYKLLDKKATIQAGKDLMAHYQQQRKKAGKRGGVTAYTYDLFHAIIRCVAPTMEDIKKHQEGLYEECRAHGEYFCFTTIPSLITLLNDTAKHKVLSPQKKTVYNQIQKLLDIGIITEKVNYVHTGKRNPYPNEAAPKGRGKIQLWISPQVLCIKELELGQPASDMPSFFGDKEKTLPQYELRSLLYKDKVLKSINNSADDVDKLELTINKALANAKLNNNHIQGKEQGNNRKKHNSPRITPRNWTKKALTAQHLWDLMRYNLYNNKSFNEQTATDCQAMLEKLLDLAAEHVSTYRKAKIQAFRQNPAFLAARQPMRLLERFSATLPQEQRAAIEIVSHAIIKQKKHAEKYDYQLYYPVDYLSSPALLKAFNYSLDDWDRIQARYFDKNKTSKAYFEQLHWIQQRYSSAVQQMHEDSPASTYKQVVLQYNQWFKQLQQNPYLNPENIQQLTNLFVQKFKPLLYNEHLQHQASKEK